MEIVSHIISCTLEMTCSEDPRARDVDPADMTNLRLVCRRWEEAAISNPLLWRTYKLDVDRVDYFFQRMEGLGQEDREEFIESIRTWCTRAGPLETGGPRRLSIIGSQRIRDEADAAVAIFSAIMGPSFVAEGELQPNWERWHFDCRQFRELVVRQGHGLKGLLLEADAHLKESIGDLGFPPLESPASLTKTLDKLKQFTLFDWRDYRLFIPGQVESLTLESLFVADRALTVMHGHLGGALVTFDAHLPMSLRFLHVHGQYSYPLDRIFHLPHLEEIVISTSALCQFIQPPGTPILNTSIRRLVLEGWAPVSHLGNLLSNLTLPRLTLLRLGSPESHRSPSSFAGNYFQQFIQRSSPPGLQLSMEDSYEWSGAELRWILQQCAGIKLERLYLDSMDALLQGEAMETIGLLIQAVKSIACKKSPASSTWRVDAEGPEYDGPRIPVYLPRSEEEEANTEMEGRIFDVQLLNHAVLDDLFDHGIQGHEYGKRYISPAFLG
ncbi:hypothetical protein BKA70DRAFT_1562432 [Coprinopsis sp. MPI-PUGE-AT-0042]|nr:hypothetical protein BKA70DRAFT_1562432 [Coprinopsis sp. MPI-PUGE-AT-0042]